MAAPVLGGDRAITVAEGGTAAVTTADLSATDPDSTDSELVYTVTGAAHGTVLEGRLGDRRASRRRTSPRTRSRSSTTAASSTAASRYR